MSQKPDPSNMRELGRRGGIASGEARRKKRSKRSVLDALKAAVSGDPDAFVGQLLSSPAGAVKAAAVLERTGLLGGEEGDAPEPPGPPVAPVGLRGLIRIAVETEQERLLLGFELTPQQRRAVLEAEGHGLEESARSARSSTAAAERAGVSTSDDGVNGTEPPEIDLSPVSSGGGESVVPLTRALARYSDAVTESVFRHRLALGLPTGHPYDVYRDAGDRL